ncbi:hypothetical protein MBRU_05880 [Mycolicibacterium brumae DSM 44177]|nr:hypothetical protein MBRU_05880 [Mycolicibacterium brumae DSM 44177]
MDAASEAADTAAHTLRLAADPRARQVRKRKYALWTGLFFIAATLGLVGITALLAVWEIPAWALIIPGAMAAGAAFPATLAMLRYRRLRATPLPDPRPANSRKLPPHGSAARPAMYALGASERGLFSLLGVIERTQLLPEEELRGLTAAANQASLAMAATAAEVVSMEKAATASPDSRGYLAPTINAYTAQLGAGVRQYNEMVTAAAHLVSSGNTGPSAAAVSPMSAQRYRGELTSATDKMLGWADAFEQLGQLRRA